MRFLKKLITAVLPMFLMLSLAGCQAAKKEVTMANFEGMAKLSVEKWLEENEIPADQVSYSYAFHETIAKDAVISQTPGAGEVIGDNDISFVFSTGPDPDAEIALIDFSGMSLEDIQKWFINEHFSRVSIEYVYDPSIPEGKFVGTNVKDGKARRSDQIVVQISANAEEAGVAVVVPDMTGWTRGKVEEWANTNKLTVTYSEVRSSTVAANYVISTEPAATKEVFRKDGLKVTLSKGPQVTAIDLTNKTSEEIEAWGKDNEIQISWIQCYNGAAKDTIYRNEPNTGTMNPGNIMKVYISAGSVPIDSFIGKNYQTAFTPWLTQINQNYNGSANLKVTVTEKEVTDKENGTILEQAPSGGTLNPGSTLAVVVAKHVDPQPEPAPEPETIDIPRMTGMSEFDFRHSLNAYGMTEGERTEQYSSIIAKDYIVWNDSGTFKPNSEIDYIVSLGTFELDRTSWEDKPLEELQKYIDSANRLGAAVILDPSYIDTGDESKDGLIIMVEGPLDDGTIHARVYRYLENSDEDPDADLAETEYDEDFGSEEGKGDDESAYVRILSTAMLYNARLFRIRHGL